MNPIEPGRLPPTNQPANPPSLPPALLMRAMLRYTAIALLYLILALPSMAWAQEAGEARANTVGWPESDTVLDLLRADARAAAAAQRFQHAPAWLPANVQGPAAGPAAGMPAMQRDEQVELLAIYGVGRALHADVSVNGAIWRYRQGSPWPLGTAGVEGHPGYGLQAIVLPCVRLRKQEALRVACLRAEAGHE
ncbi:hypothetical protein [Bordetella sp. 2513F-2]